MTIDYDYKKLYNYQIFGNVGTTTELAPSRRVTLPQPAPSDANAIWLAPNGNDANPGTSGSPVLTLAVALSLLTAGKPTINIFRNGYAGTIEFRIVGGLSLPYGREIQAENGEIATLYTDTIGDKLTVFASTASNGINFEERSGQLTDDVIEVDTTGANPGDLVAFQNCNFRRLASSSINPPYFLVLTGSPDINYQVQQCLFVGPYMLFCELESIAPGNVQLSNSVFIRPPLFVDNFTNSQMEWAIALRYEDNTGGRRASFDWSNLLFYGYSNFFWIFSSLATSTGTQQVLNLRGADFYQIGNLAEATEGVVPPKRYAQLSIEQSRPGYVTGVQLIPAAGGVGFDVDVAVANNVDGNIPGLYVDEESGATGIPEGFQLQRIGKPSQGTGNYFLDSPLIGAGPPSFGTDDVSPWIEVAPLTSAGWNESINITWVAESYSLTYRRMNAGSITDVNGNIHTVDDGIRRTFTIDFGSGETYANNNDFRKLVNALADRGSLKFLPRDGDNLFPDAVTCNTVDNGDTMTVSPSLGSGNAMIARNWAGFWATIGGLNYYISENDATTLTVIDKLGNGFPADGNYSFAVNHILVKTSQADLVGLQERFTEFDRGGRFRENADDETLCFELRGYSIVLEEVEDPEEGV